jgi:hypothetical protein
MVYGSISRSKLPESRVFPHSGSHKSLELKKSWNGTVIAIKQAPVMYRRWKISDQPKKSRHPARASANEAVLKRGRPAGEV